jgi:hypothetical protein
MPPEVICQGWTEIEVGDAIRPGDHTLHLDMDSRNKFVKKIEDEQSVIQSRGEAILLYQPDSEPYKCEVDDQTFKEIESQANENGKWITSDPPAGKKSGWIPVEEALEQL